MAKRQPSEKSVTICDKEFRLFKLVIRSFRLLPVCVLLLASNAQSSPPPIELIFNDPFTNAAPADACDRPVCRSLVDLINASASTVDFAIYGMRRQSDVLSALVRAEERGVRVRGVVDRDINGANYYSDTPRLVAALDFVKSDFESDLATKKIKDKNDGGGFQAWCPSPSGFSGPIQCVGYAVPDNKCLMASHASREELSFVGDIMHNKFFVIDGKRIWTGSANVSDSGTGGYNANAVVLIDDDRVADWFTKEFEQMFEKGEYHRKKRVNGRAAVNTVNWGDIELTAKFSPQGYAMVDYLDGLLVDATKSIDVAVFFLTHKRLTHHLIKAHNRGVKVRVIIDATAAKNGYSKHELLRAAGVPVKVENWGGKMHMKSALIDGKNLVLGSMNWTSAGERDNDENTLFLTSAKLGLKYSEFFQELWESIPDKWLQENPDPESLNSGTSCMDFVDNDFDNLVDLNDGGCGTKPNPMPDLPSYWVVPKAEGHGLVKGNINKSGRRYYFLPTDKYYERTKINTAFGERWFCSPIEATEAGWSRPRYNN